MRILSLAPTQTEIVAALGQLESLAGRTENCDYPDGAKSIPTFGSWYAPDLNAVIRAQPDLVCTFGKHQEEIMTTLAEAGLRVYHSDPGSVRAALDSMREMSEILDCTDQGKALIASLRRRLHGVKAMLARLPRREPPKVFRIMNWHPLITVGPGSFQHDAIEMAGGRNIMEDGIKPYFVCDPGEVRKRNPDAVFFCEPQIRPFLEKDPAWKQVRAVRLGRVFLFDCGLTCRSGPRIVDMVEQLARALHHRADSR
jgi:iron complex transport system substrate-binding protein